MFFVLSWGLWKQLKAIFIANFERGIAIAEGVRVNVCHELIFNWFTQGYFHNYIYFLKCYDYNDEHFRACQDNVYTIYNERFMSEDIERCNHVNSIDQNQLPLKILMNREYLYYINFGTYRVSFTFYHHYKSIGVF